jgi:hypothetical protein
MVEGLWSVEFASSQGFVGAGVAVFETQRIFGDDSFYFYVEDYRVDKNNLFAKITVTHYNGPTSFDFRE